MNKIRIVYGLLSLFALILGMTIYIMFRDLNNLILFSWIQKPEFFETVLFPLKPSILTDILRFNIPDMLWFVSGILFLRFFWFYNNKTQFIYIVCFYVLGFLFELSQLFEFIPGTFDWLDLLFMSIGAFVEGIIYKIQLDCLYEFRN